MKKILLILGVLVTSLAFAQTSWAPPDSELEPPIPEEEEEEGGGGGGMTEQLYIEGHTVGDEEEPEEPDLMIEKEHIDFGGGDQTCIVDYISASGNGYKCEGNSPAMSNEEESGEYFVAKLLCGRDKSYVALSSQGVNQAFALLLTAQQLGSAVDVNLGLTGIDGCWLINSVTLKAPQPASAD